MQSIYYKGKKGIQASKIITNQLERYYVKVVIGMLYLRYMVYMTRKEHFNAAHKLYNEKWTEEENRKIYGKCANENWHGHNYDLYVTIKGEPDESGFLMNAHHLSSIVKTEVVDQLDHKNMNLDVPFLKGVQPTSENLVKIIWQKLQPHITNCKLHCIKLVETENIYVEYYGD